MTPARRPEAEAIRRQDLVPAAVNLVRGPDESIRDRAISHLRGEALRNRPDADLIEVDAAAYKKGDLQLWTSPSLFSSAQVIIIPSVTAGPNELVEDLLELVGAVPEGTTVIVGHAGGNRAPQLATAVKKAGYPVWKAGPLKPSARPTLVGDEARHAWGSFTLAAAKRLAEAVGDDTAELLGITRQLVSDYGGQVNEEVVEEYFAGRQDTTGFAVAEAMAEGEGPRAVVLLRRAVASGVVPVLVVAALATKLRQLAKVSEPGAGRNLGMAPWQVDRARQQVRGWSGDTLGAAICLVAQADADVKGASRNAAGAIEKCLIEISRLRAGMRA